MIDYPLLLDMMGSQSVKIMIMRLTESLSSGRYSVLFDMLALPDTAMSDDS